MPAKAQTKLLPPAASVMRYYCPECQGAIPLEAVSDQPSVTPGGTWQRTVSIDCEHCNKHFALSLVLDVGSMTWDTSGLAEGPRD